MDYNKKKEVNQSRTLLLAGLSILCLVVLNGLIVNFKDGKSLADNYAHTKGKISKFEVVAARNTYPAICSYQVNGKECNCELPSDLFCRVLNTKEKLQIQTISFDLVYDSEKPSNCQILSSAKLYSKYPQANSKLAVALEEYFNCDWSIWRWLN